MNKKDVMELLYKIQDECKHSDLCIYCKWYSEKSGDCVFYENPDEWNVPEITERSVESL